MLIELVGATLNRRPSGCLRHGSDTHDRRRDRQPPAERDYLGHEGRSGSGDFGRSSSSVPRASSGQSHQDVGIPRAIEPERLVGTHIACRHVETRRVYPEQKPGQAAESRIVRRVAHDHR